MVVSGVVNPPIGGFTTNFLGSIGSDVAYPTDFSTITLLPNSFTSCSTNFNSAFGNTSSQLTISTSSVNRLSTNAYITVTFPFFWTRDYGRQFLRFNPDQFCTSLMGMLGIVCTGGVNAYN